MENLERFQKTLNFDKTVDRVPMIEWAGWWDKTVTEWWKQGLPKDIELANGLNDYFGQDRLMQFWIPPRDVGCPQPAYHGAPLINDEADYEAIKKYLFTDHILNQFYDSIKNFSEANKDNGFVYWFSLEGFFWFPRTLFGIENHLYAFYDYPELMHQMNKDLLEFNKKALDVVFSLVSPTYMTFAEDMSYNHGPMISRELFDEFMLPYYKEIVPLVKAHGTKVFIDTDGNVEPLIPWFLDAGIQGVLPLERMAGVDVNNIRKNYPDFLMIGGFDKTIMHKGEEAMRAEFERLLPAIRSGGYIPAVDHQTPPDVSLENYHTYMRLMREYGDLTNKG